MIFLELLEKYKSQDLDTIYGLISENFQKFIDLTDEYSNFKLKSDQETLNFLMMGMIASDDGIDQQEIDFLERIYRDYFPDVTPLNYRDVSLAFNEIERKGTSEMLDIFTLFLEGIPSILSVENDRYDEYEIKKIFISVIFSIFYSNGYLDSKQKEFLKKIEAMQKAPRTHGIDDISYLIEKYKGYSREELVEIFATNIKKLDDEHKPFISAYPELDSFNSYRTFNEVLIPLLAIDGEIDQEEFDFLEECRQRVTPSEPAISLEIINKTILSSSDNFKIMLNARIKAIHLMEQLAPGVRDSFLNVMLTCFAVNKVIDSSQKSLLKDLLVNEDQTTSTSSPSESSSSKSSGSISKPANTTKADDVIVSNFGATVIQDDDQYYVSFGAFIYNPNPNHQANNVTVKINCKDSSGRVVETVTKTIYHIDPSTIFNFGEEIYISYGEPTSVSIVASAEGFTYVADGSRSFDGVRISDYSYSSADWGDDYILSGQATSSYTKKLDSVSVYLVFTNASNEIQGGTNLYFSDLFPNVTEGFNERVKLNMNNASYINSSIDMYSGGTNTINVSVNLNME